MKILQLTDIHLTTPGQTILGRDSNTNFRKALSHALNDHADADLLVITGDLSDWGDEADYKRLRGILDELPVEWALCIGNHDNRERFLSVFPELADENGFVQSVRDMDAGRFVFLDTNQPGTHAGCYCDQRKAWLESQLESCDGPIYLFMHHNPMPVHLAPLDSIRLHQDDAFREFIAGHAQKIRHIFFGHCHLPLAGSVAGIPTTSLRGTNHQGFANFSEKELLTSSHLPQAYGVAFLADDYVTVHMIEFGYEGELKIEGSPDYKQWDRASMER
nr:phosphodiesterase [uncultured Cohaesibacter sp.]